MSVHVYMLFTNILPGAICCCLETCNQCLCGVVDVVMHNYVYKLSWPLLLTLGTYRYI